MEIQPPKEPKVSTLQNSIAKAKNYQRADGPAAPVAASPAAVDIGKTAIPGGTTVEPVRGDLETLLIPYPNIGFTVALTRHIEVELRNDVGLNSSFKSDYSAKGFR